MNLLIHLPIFSIVAIIIGAFIFYRQVPKKENSVRLFGEIVKTLLETLDFTQAVNKIVNLMLTELDYIHHGYQIIVLSLLDTEKQEMRRIAISQTELAKQFLKESPIPFKDIVIPLSSFDNLMVKVINEKKMHITENVSDVLEPALDSEWVKSFQKQLGIKTTVVFPIISRDKPLGVLIFSLTKNKNKISKKEWSILETFAGVVGVALDNILLLNSLSQTANQLHFANEQLKQMDHLKDEFVSLASHELRTPMTAIKSYLWLFLEQKEKLLNPKQQLYIERAYAATDRLITLVNDMLNVSRIESGRLGVILNSVDLVQLVKEVIDELSPTAVRQEVQLVLDIPQEALPNVTADQNKIREVIINLVGNSLKFTNPGGKITLKLYRQGEQIITQVIDTGKGIKQEDMPKLFQKFGIVGNNYLEKQNTQGTGLGLYISKSIIELHGGKIWVHSDGDGKGTTFSFSLNIAPTKQETQLPTQLTAPNGQQLTGTIKRSQTIPAMHQHQSPPISA